MRALLEACVASGIDVILRCTASFFFNAHNNFLEEIAKFRAARRLWARLMRDRFGATEARAQQLKQYVGRSGRRTRSPGTLAWVVVLSSIPRH